MSDIDTAALRELAGVGLTTLPTPIYAALLDAFDAVTAERDRLREWFNKPCGSCHPCMNWSAEVLRRAIQAAHDADSPEEAHAILAAALTEGEQP